MAQNKTQTTISGSSGDSSQQQQQKEQQKQQEQQKRQVQQEQREKQRKAQQQQDINEQANQQNASNANHEVPQADDPFGVDERLKNAAKGLKEKVEKESGEELKPDSGLGLFLKALAIGGKEIYNKLFAGASNKGIKPDTEQIDEFKEELKSDLQALKNSETEEFPGSNNSELGKKLKDLETFCEKSSKKKYEGLEGYKQYRNQFLSRYKQLCEHKEFKNNKQFDAIHNTARKHAALTAVNEHKHNAGILMTYMEGQYANSWYDVKNKYWHKQDEFGKQSKSGAQINETAQTGLKELREFVNTEHKPGQNENYEAFCERLDNEYNQIMQKLNQDGLGFDPEEQDMISAMEVRARNGQSCKEQYQDLTQNIVNPQQRHNVEQTQSQRHNVVGTPSELCNAKTSYKFDRYQEQDAKTHLRASEPIAQFNADPQQIDLNAGEVARFACRHEGVTYQVRREDDEQFSISVEQAIGKNSNKPDEIFANQTEKTKKFEEILTKMGAEDNTFTPAKDENGKVKSQNFEAYAQKKYGLRDEEQDLEKEKTDTSTPSANQPR